MKAIIGIDAGHGGNSFGTYSFKTVKDGLFEKDYTLELALLVEEKLLQNGFGVIMTRKKDMNPGTVTERAKRIIEGKADFALSLHFNGVENKNAKGCEIYVPYGETAAGIESGFYKRLGAIFGRREPFARSNNYNDRNEIFDKKLNAEKRKFGAVSDEKDYFGFIRKCWSEGISADLLETCFLTNPEDFEKYVKNKEAVADAIAESIVESFGEKYEKENSTVVVKLKPKIKKSMKIEKEKGNLHLRE